MTEAHGRDTSISGTNSRPLIVAIDEENVAEIEALLKTGIDPNDFAGTYYAAVHMAASKGNIRIMQALLAAGADINLPNKHPQRETPLFNPIHLGSVQMARFMIEKGANVNARTSHGYSVLHAAANSHENSLKIVRLLVKHGADVNAAAKNETTVLRSAAIASNSEVVEFLLKSGANPEAQTAGSTVISQAIANDDEETVKVLLKYRVSLTNRKPHDGFAPLHDAAYYGNMTIVKMLLAAGANPSFPTTNGKLADEIAENKGHPELAEYLTQARQSK